ncbi:hypothetical protein [Vibrio parahaemolyticus]|nr:hypothetical protein [Vibrio parahaemolyticus]EIV8646710.1 hypothetical protein [Vibrio parahaemolyticus]EIV8675654.1 hypothetical protein [Vibrio parahaemolyticus]ELA6986606.1 hypothetical protein [Vibrio parahaemolyticus]MBE4057599.1 hypothetical protein [Vibrio parahaemolyticus]MBE4094236.1 hypothetical protein [Vibrio parahaemolyticus]
MRFISLFLMFWLFNINWATAEVDITEKEKQEQIVFLEDILGQSSSVTPE